MKAEYPIHRLDVSAYTVPTDSPESDGTFTWDHTTIIVVELYAGNAAGMGYTYGDKACGRMIDRIFTPLLLGRDALAIPDHWMAMQRQVRNIGRPAVAAMAIAAVDAALWDLKARLLGVALVDLLGSVRDGIPVYGSGGFTSYSLEQLEQQFGRWSDMGITRMKMKVG